MRGRGSELEFGDFPTQVVIREAQVDAGGVDVAVAQLLLEGVQTPTTVQEVDGIAMAKQVSVDIAGQVGPAGRTFDNLVSSLLGDVATLSGPEQVVLLSQRPFLRMEQDGAHQPILDEYHPLYRALPQDSEAIPGNILQPDADSFGYPDPGLPEQPEEEVVPFIGSGGNDLVGFFGCEVVGQPTAQMAGYLGAGQDNP